MSIKTPARLHKKEPITLKYNRQRVYLMGAIFIATLVAVAFNIGSENINYLIGGCV